MGSFSLVSGAIFLSALWANATLAQPTTAPQWAPDSSSVTVPAGPQYARGAIWRALWGKHYRAWWDTPVQAPVLRLHEAGLVPLQAGGSYQSRTLRLQAADGRQYVLRSVDKDASGALTGWKRSLLGGLMRDQTSVILPYGALPAAALAEAAGVYHANPRLVFVPADTALRQYKPRYANALYWLEERPDDDQRKTASFGRSREVVSSAKMLKRIHEQTDEQVEARAFLRARLLDVFIGDWSRREDQWRWARFGPEDGAGRYRPIPRDRDQAFFLFNDGALTKLISVFLTKFQSFGPKISKGKVEPLTRTARNLDRTLLAYLTPADFQAVADSMQRRLTDEALTAALATGPAATRERTRQRILPQLQARRAQLPAVAAQYFKLLNEEAWLIGTDQPERFVLSAAGDGRLKVRVFSRGASGTETLLGEQTYDRKVTKQLEVFGLGGDDMFEVEGTIKPGFDLHLYGGAGANKLLSTAKTDKLVWFTGPGSGAAPAFAETKPAAEPQQIADAEGWLSHYNLDD